MCSVEYKGNSYAPKENFNLCNRQRINFFNIDIDQLVLPKDFYGKEISLDTKLSKDFQINISVAQQKKIIGIFSNIPFDEPNLKENEELLNEIKNSVDKAKKIIDFQKDVNGFYRRIR